MGQDPLTGNNYDHRRECLRKLIAYQAQIFAFDLGSYSILENHS